MARPPTISREQILDAARAEFLERGPAATTADIARRAGISEGSIFRRFDTKEDLLVEALLHHGDPAWMALAESLAGTGDLRENIEQITHALLDYFRRVVPAAMMLIACRIAPADIFRRQPDPMPARSIRTLSHFILAEQRLGRIRPCDPEIVARQLLSAMHFYVFCDHARINERMPMADTTYVRGVVDNLLRGISPENVGTINE
jgi:AcrR family transcriptional regulator